MPKSKTGGAERTAKQKRARGKKSKVDWSAVAKKRLESLKKREFHCPVHRAEEFIGLTAWASHRRWCRAGAKPSKRATARQVRKAKVDRKPAAARRPHKQYRARKPALRSIPFDLHQSTVLLKNSKRVIKLASFVHGDSFDRLAARLTKMIGSGFSG